MRNIGAVKKERSLLQIIQKRKANWVENILRGQCKMGTMKDEKKCIMYFRKSKYIYQRMKECRTRLEKVDKLRWK